MKIIIDIDTLSRVFNCENKEHKKFRCVKDGINCGKCKLVYGGNDYMESLRKSPNYLNTIKELKNINRAELIESEKVDIEKNNVDNRAKLLGIKINDSHIIALQIISLAEIICSYNRKHYKNFTNKKLYPKKHRIARIFNGGESLN